MFRMQVVLLEIVEISSGPLYPCFPRKWYALKLLNPQGANFSMFPSQMVRLKIVEPSVAHFFHAYLANGTP